MRTRKNRRTWIRVIIKLHVYFPVLYLMVGAAFFALHTTEHSMAYGIRFLCRQFRLMCFFLCFCVHYTLPPLSITQFKNSWAHVEGGEIVKKNIQITSQVLQLSGISWTCTDCDSTSRYWALRLLMEKLVQIYSCGGYKTSSNCSTSGSHTKMI